MFLHKNVCRNTRFFQGGTGFFPLCTGFFFGTTSLRYKVLLVVFVLFIYGLKTLFCIATIACILECCLKKLESIQKSGCSHQTLMKEGVNPFQVPTKPKRTFNQFHSWNFCCTIQTNLLGEPSVSFNAKKILLSKHL